MPAFEPQDPGFAGRVRESFERQTLMATLGARLARVAPGEVEIELPFRADLLQQHGFIHAGIMTALVDSACGYAALSLMPADAEVLTVEYKVNFVSPGIGDRMIARGRVTKPGRTITVCAGDVFGVQEGKEKLVATMLATMVAVRGRAGASPERQR
jgi:uncharacterized protein (TIGR00369 family)